MADAQRSKWFQEFVAGVQAPITRENIEDYDSLGALHLLKGDERTEAEDLLLERLADGDGRAAHALADIGCTRAIPAMRAQLRHHSNHVRLTVAASLRQLGDDTGRSVVTEILSHGERTERLIAVSVLGLWSGPEVDQALETAFADPDRTVRSAANGKLMSLHGLGKYRGNQLSRLGQLAARLASPLTSVRADALSELHDIFDRTARGESPEQLGLTDVMDIAHEPLQTFERSVSTMDPPWQDDFAWQSIAPLTGRDRRWAEDRLWFLLPEDPRVARAYAQLGVTRAIEPLRELLQTAQGAVAVEAAAALWKLAGDAAAQDQLRAIARGADPALAARARAALGT
jgi:hypothetical protein